MNNHLLEIRTDGSIEILPMWKLYKTERSQYIPSNEYEIRVVDSEVLEPIKNNDKNLNRYLINKR